MRTLNRQSNVRRFQLPTLWSELCSTIDRALGSSRKLGGTAEHLIDGRQKRIGRLSFEF